MRFITSRYATSALAILALTGASLTAAGAAAAVAQSAPAAHHGQVRGDLDGDGHRDVVVGAPGGERVRVTYSHAKPGGSHVQWLTLPEPSLSEAGFGATLAVGDFNGDGFSDLAVGAPGWTNPTTVGSNSESQGGVYLYRGSKTGLHNTGVTLHGPYNGEDPYNLGSILAAADIDHDGHADLVVKVDGGDNQQIRVMYGRAAGLDVDHPQFFDDFGAQSFALGDINSDGYPDLALGDETDLSSTSTVFEGAVQVIYGSNGGLTNHHRQKIPGAKFHVRVGLGQATAVGDINHDGYADVIVGDAAASYYPHHLSPGKVIVLLGGKHGVSAKRSQVISEDSGHLAKHTRTRDLFGWDISIGKVRGKKFADVVIGAPGVKVGSHKGAGAIYLLHGSKAGLSLKHTQRLTQSSKGIPGRPQKNAKFGNTVAVQVLNGDRFADLIVGAPDASPGVTHGGLYDLLRGSARGLSAKHASSVGDSTANDRLGAAIAR